MSKVNLGKIITEEQAKINALAAHLECSIEDAESAMDDYCIYTDDEATEACKKYILESLWAFNYSFLCCHSDAIAAIPEKEFKDMQGKLCESFNKAILAMIDDIDHFIDDAIACDGRGHFLSSYDGQEHEQDGFYIYRNN